MTNLRNELRKLNLRLDGNDVTDNTVSDYSQDRNVAQVRQNANGTYTVNVWRGRWYKPGEAVVVDSVEAVITAIKNRPKKEVE